LKIIKDKKEEIPIFFLIGFSFFVFSLLYIFSYKYLPREMKGCNFRSIFHFPCPSCGGTRAISNLIEGKIGRSFLENPLIFFVSVFLFVFSVISIYTYLKGYKLKLILEKKEILFLKIFLIFAFFLNWAYLILKEVI